MELFYTHMYPFLLSSFIHIVYQHFNFFFKSASVVSLQLSLDTWSI